MLEGGLKNRLRFLVALVPLFFPLYFVRFELYSIPFSAPELIVYVLFALWGVSLIWDPPQLEHRPPRTFWLMLAILFVAALSLLKLPVEITFEGEVFRPLMDGLGIWKGWLLAPILYAILLMQLTSAFEYQLMVRKFFLWGATLLALHAIFLGDIAADGRLLGHFANPNYLALYLAPAFWMAGTELARCYKRDGLEKLIWVVAIGIALFLTRSYAAWISLIVVAVLAVINSFDGRKKWAFIGMLGVAVLLLVLAELGSDKFTQTFDLLGRSSSAVRLQIWQVALTLWTKAPIFGIGLGFFQLEYFMHAWEILGQAPLEWHILHTHNLYLQWLTETGLVGLLLFLYFISLLLRKRSLLGERDMRFVLLVILVQGFIDLPLFKTDLAFEFFMVAGLIAAGHHILRGKVKAGDGIAGTRLKVPTVNFDTELGDHLDGVYAAWAHWRGQVVKSLVFAGESYTSKKNRKFEAHLLGVNTNLYGEMIDLEIVEKIRNTKKFRSVDSLKKQLQKDCQRVEKLLS